MIIVTGAAGFIGSVFVGYLNAAGYGDLALVDDFDTPDRRRHLRGKRYTEEVQREGLEDYLREARGRVTAVFHLGANTDTAERDRKLLADLNLRPSQRLWRFCTEEAIPLIYASSASTYGDGALGYDDRHDVVDDLAPLNPYAQSKQDFDHWALRQNRRPPFWAGLKFFNVYGPNEGHKGRMASVVYHAFHQISTTGRMRLFRSHRDDVADGDQARDFVYVRDVCEVMLWLYRERPASGLYNVGSGEARTFTDLARAVFDALGQPVAIDFVDTPEQIRDAYQYYTRADIGKLRAAGYDAPTTRLEDGVREYVTQFLARGVAC